MITGTPWNEGSKVSRTITPNEYFALADRFHPLNYHPEQWLEAAKKAGVTYAVMTTKHHDGYTLWPSNFAEMGVHTHLGGRDLVGPFVEACRQLGIRVGLYYSPPDWHFEREYMSFEYSSFHRIEAWRRSGVGSRPETTIYGLDHKPRNTPPYPPDFAERIACHVRCQIEELLTNYGTIDLLWFDGRPYPLGTSGEITIVDIRALQPGIVVNPRLFGKGDYVTPEVKFPQERPAGPWELCTFWNTPGWGFMSGETYRSTAEVLSEFVRIRAWGGNELISVGPNADGALPGVAYDRLRELSEWMNKNSAAILGTAPCPPSIAANVPVTSRKQILYLHALPGDNSAIVVEGIVSTDKVCLLRDGTAVPFELDEGTLRLTIPEAVRSSLVDVVQVTCTY